MIFLRIFHTDLRIAFRSRSKPQISSDPSTSILNQKDKTRKQPPDATLHRLLHPKSLKAQASKSKGKMKPIDLDLSRLTLTDIEGDAGKDITLQEKDFNRSTAAISFNADDGVAGVKIADSDARMAGAE